MRGKVVLQIQLRWMTQWFKSSQDHKKTWLDHRFWMVFVFKSKVSEREFRACCFCRRGWVRQQKFLDWGFNYEVKSSLNGLSSKMSHWSQLDIEDVLQIVHVLFPLQKSKGCYMSFFFGGWNSTSRAKKWWYSTFGSDLESGNMWVFPKIGVPPNHPF